MIPEFAYFLKVNIAFALFYAFYRLFFYKDTFFKLRRAILLAFFGLAFLYPLLNIREWVKEQKPMTEVIRVYSTMMSEVTVQAGPAATDWGELLSVGLSGIYFGVMALLGFRFLVQWGSILWLARGCRRESVLGVPIYRLNRPGGPFSFFRMIFLYPVGHSEKELEEILAHERTHVAQWHSIDVIVGELIAIFCWVNPFVWLLKREVRYNLEYLADNKVIQSGYDSKSYQYHLLELSYHPNHLAAANLYNSFHVLHLKNRISMMNKKRSHGIGRTKYALFLPLVATLMLLSNVEAVARMAKEMTSGVVSPQDDKGKAQSAAYRKSLEHKVEIIDDSDPSDPVYRVADQMPRFQGGDAALIRFLGEQIQYPKEAQDQKIEGRVITRFVVDKDGSVTDAGILRGIHPLLDAEALRVVRLFPKWEPGIVDGKPVRVMFTVPIAFSLPEAQ